MNNHELAMPETQPAMTIGRAHAANEARLNDEVTYLKSKIKAMSHYMQHLSFCSKSPCSCGLDDLKRIP
jgi:hypothetical protein